MHQYQLFLHVLQDLAERVGGPRDDYRVLKTSGLLRQLLLDSTPLALSVNRALRVPLTFKVSGMDVTEEILPGSPPASRYTSPDPYGGQGQEMKLEAFLRHTVITLADASYSVRNVIKCSAHVMGGVHFFDPDDEREEALMH